MMRSTHVDGQPTTLTLPFRSTKASTRSRASHGSRTMLVTPGRDSFAQSYFRSQYRHWMLQAGATGRWILPKVPWAFTLKQGWVLRMS